MEQPQEAAGTGQTTASRAGQTAGAPAKSGDWIDSPAEPREPAADAVKDPGAARQKNPEADGAAKQRDAADPFAGVMPEKRDDPAKTGDGDAAQEAPAGGDKPLELALPEGFVRDEEIIGQFRDIAREAGIKQEAAQKLVDMHVEGQRRMAEAFTGEHKRIIDRVNAGWIAENQADPEFGGDKFDEANNYLTKAIRTFVPDGELRTRDGRPGFLEFFEQANLRNAPHLRRFFIRVGKYISEAEPIASDAPEAKDERTRADRMFPDLPSARE